VATKSVVIRVDSDMWDRLKTRAKQLDLQTSQLMRRLIYECLEMRSEPVSSESDRYNEERGMEEIESIVSSVQNHEK